MRTFLNKALKVVVIGSGGRLGGELVGILSQCHQVTGLDHSDLNFLRIEEIESRLSDQDYDVLLNAAALTDIDYCEKNQEEAMQVNARAPERIAEIVRKKGARFIHFSTDYVFDGKENSARTEIDSVAPICVYGMSKAEGEKAVLSVSEEFLVARVSWIFGSYRESFIDKVIRRAMNCDRVSAIIDKFSIPTYSYDLARMVELLLGRPDISGLLHLCSTGSCSWQEYAQVGLKAALCAGFNLKAHTVDSSLLADFDFCATRPKYTAMNTERFVSLSGYRPRSWESAVKEYILSIKR